MEYSTRIKKTGRILITLLIILSTFMLISCWNDLVDVYNQRGEETTGPPPVIEPVTWIKASDGNIWSRWGHTSVVYDNKMWIIGGRAEPVVETELRVIYYSSDGANWYENNTVLPPWASYRPRAYHSNVVFNGKIYVLGGYVDFDDTPEKVNDVWYSEDCVNWFEPGNNASWDPLSGHSSVVFNGEIWVLGGNGSSYSNEVHHSPDGDSWAEDYTAQWDSRFNHVTVVFDGKIWVLGGYTQQTGASNDIWYSANGSSWEEAYPLTTLWSPRYNHTCVVYQNKIWVLGGYDAGTRYNDVWCSEDGVNWYEVPYTDEIWSVRDGHTSVVFNNRLWVIGGSDGSDLGDVWYIE